VAIAEARWLSSASAFDSASGHLGIGLARFVEESTARRLLAL
jgi:hypothetical protein